MPAQQNKPSNAESEYIDIVLTGVKLHTAKPRKPVLMAESIKRKMHGRKPGKFFGERFRPLDKNGEPQTKIRIANIGPLQELARKTGKQIRIHLPPGGAPIYFADDVKTDKEKRKRQKE